VAQHGCEPSTVFSASHPITNLRKDPQLRLLCTPTWKGPFKATSSMVSKSAWSAGSLNCSLLTLGAE